MSAIVLKRREDMIGHALWTTLCLKGFVERRLRLAAFISLLIVYAFSLSIEGSVISV